MKRFIVLSFISFLFLTGCKKTVGSGMVGITVVTEKGLPIQNCSVRLDVPVEGATEYFGKTDVNGYIEFESGLHVYYDVYVWKGLWEGCDFVEIKPGSLNLKSVIIFPPGNNFNGCL
jgi:hypothetical protein